MLSGSSNHVESLLASPPPPPTANPFHSFPGIIERGEQSNEAESCRDEGGQEEDVDVVRRVALQLDRVVKLLKSQNGCTAEQGY